jgi:hypothetical protein
MFTKVARVQTCSFRTGQVKDGSFVKKCAIEMAKAFSDSGMAEKFEMYPCLIKQWQEE